MSLVRSSLNCSIIALFLLDIKLIHTNLKIMSFFKLQNLNSLKLTCSVSWTPKLIYLGDCFCLFVKIIVLPQWHTASLLSLLENRIKFMSYHYRSGFSSLIFSDQHNASEELQTHFVDAEIAQLLLC